MHFLKFLQAGDSPFTSLGLLCFTNKCNNAIYRLYIPVFPILTDSIESTHRIDKYFVDYRIVIDQISMTVLPNYQNKYAPNCSAWFPPDLILSCLFQLWFCRRCGSTSVRASTPRSTSSE